MRSRAGAELAAEARGAEVRRPPKRVTRSARASGSPASAAAISASSSARVTSSGSCAAQAARRDRRLDRVETASRSQMAATTRASSALITGSASRPACSTSAWLSGSGEMPAARFVMSEKPRISMPASRAAIASSAVDIPTMCPPMVFAICTSAGVS